MSCLNKQNAVCNPINLKMSTLVIVAQLIIALSIVVVWVFRFDNIVLEFKQYGLPDLVCTMVGATKIALATLLVAGIWYPDLVVVPALLMAFLMLCAQVTHTKVRNQWHKYVPSLVLLLSLFVARAYAGVITV